VRGGTEKAAEASPQSAAEGKEAGHGTGPILPGPFPITFNGRDSIVLAPGEEVLCDKIDAVIEPGMNPKISIYFKEETEVSCAVLNWAGGNNETVLIRGDYAKATDSDVLPAEEVYPYQKDLDVKNQILIGISEIKVLTDKKPETIAMFGDSITHMSFYANALMSKLYRRYPGRISVINCGYSGNRVLRDASFIEEAPGHGKNAGPAALSRFESDVYGYTGPDYIFFLEGVNDLMHPYALGRLEELPSARELTGAYSELIDIAHKKGSLFFLSTICPYRSEIYPIGDEGLEVLKEVNDYIKTQTEADGVFDFAGVLRDPADPAVIDPRYHLGDGLHPGPEGGRRMAQEALRVFCEKCQL
ncbi:MAG: hypothetical protein ILP10_04315, partial [Lachnospiraceae bacterium]|nr:hypothetical protein [Lachnospiraceae bacterium]